MLGAPEGIRTLDPNPWQGCALSAGCPSQVAHRQLGVVARLAGKE